MNQPSHQTVGERLRAAREQKGISLPDAARATHIRANYLDELENDHPEMFQSAVQARGFLRLYAAFLELPAEELINLWENPKIEETEIIEPASIDDHVVEKTDQSAPKQTEETTEKGPSQNKQMLFFSVLNRIKEFISAIGKWVTSLPFVNKISQLIPKALVSSRPKRERAAEAEPPRENSEEIFREIGEALRTRRQKMDLDLADVEHFTNLKRMYLIAMEDGRFSDLPSTVQGRGMLNNYAQFLAMDDSAVMDRYGRALQQQREERMPPPRLIEPPVSVGLNLPEGVRRVLNPDLVVGGAIIVALFGFILWGTMQIIGSSGNGEATEAPSISEMLQITPTVTPMISDTQTVEGSESMEAATEVPGVAVVQATATPIATVNAAPLQLYIIANDRAYLRVSVDGQEVFNGRVAPANAYTYSGNSQITLMTGNAAALEVYFNQEYLGQLGAVGEVVNLRFAPSGLSTATPQATPQATTAPTATPEPQITDEMMNEGN